MTAGPASKTALQGGLAIVVNNIFPAYLIYDDIPPDLATLMQDARRAHVQLPGIGRHRQPPFSTPGKGAAHRRPA